MESLHCLQRYIRSNREELWRQWCQTQKKAMVGSLNHQMPAFIKHYLLYRGLPQDFVTRLIVASCCSTLVGEINTVRWDKENLELITTEDVEEEARLSAFEKADWFMDLERLQVSHKRRRSTSQHLKPFSTWMKSSWLKSYMPRTTSSAPLPGQEQKAQALRGKP